MSKQDTTRGLVYTREDVAKWKTRGATTEDLRTLNRESITRQRKEVRTRGTRYESASLITRTLTDVLALDVLDKKLQLRNMGLPTE